ncbi:MAG: ABC transporter ATP-binding protein [Ignavibacteriaceae bacterium]
MANDKVMVEVINLCKSFDSLVVLDNIYLKVYNAENFVVFGRSGTGKSVLLKCLVRLMEPDSGEIFIDNVKVNQLKLKELNNLRKQIGFLFQSAALYDSMTVKENLEFPLRRNFNFSEEEINQRVAEALESVKLSEAINKMPSELSGGMRKRIGLARSIITKPKLMLYDEPTTGLDPITSKEISELILQLQKDLNMTSIIVTHDLLCARIIADRAIMLKDAKVSYEGSIDELTSSKDIFLRNFFSNEVLHSEE